jgi:hypothetical protein
MLDFNWNDLNLTNRKYICLLAGIHESHAYLSYEEFSAKCELRETNFAHRIASAGAHWTAATGGYWIPDTFANDRGGWTASSRWGDDAFTAGTKRESGRAAKFRQLVDGKWHYWGFIDDEFRGPVSAGRPSQQFTGLYSKSRQEIYEGDIGKIVLDSLIPLYVVCVVEWSAEAASFHWKTIQVINMKSTGKEWRMQESRRFQIIGNIYENPELILR